MALPNAGANQSVESLILKATNPLNKADDPNIIQCICQTIANEVGGIQSAIRLLIHKMQSPQEKEAMQSLLVLQACVNNCGQSFHSEIGKFRFLNEMIKLVSPKYLGNQTALNVKERVTELLYTWTIDLPEEPKIQEAYTMLKKQGVVKDDPTYLGVRCNTLSKVCPSASYEDDEKSRALQRLLQSTRPEDIVKANALIKNMVKEDERRLERTSRRIVEVETAINNVKVLDEMLNQFEETHSVSKADAELMEELNSSCSGLRSSIHRIVSEMDEKDDGLGELIKASDELFRVMGRYKLITESRSKSEAISVANCISVKPIEEDTLLDLLDSTSTPHINDFKQEQTELLLETSNLSSNGVKKNDTSILNELEDIFSSENPESSASNKSKFEDNLSLLMADPSIPHPLIPQKYIMESHLDHISKEISSSKPLNDLDLLGSTLLQESLPRCIPRIGLQFKPQEKVSLNEMKQKYKNSPPPYNEPQSKSISDLQISDQNFLQPFREDEKLMENLDDVSILSYKSIENNKVISNDIHQHNIDLLHEASALNSLNEQQIRQGELDVDSLLTLQDEKKNPVRRSISSNAQLCEVKAMNDLTVSLEDIKPGNHAPIKLIESNGISLTLHFTENKPREDVSIVVVSVTSINSHAVTNYTLQAVVPKGCKVRLLPPSSTKLCEFSPFLPPPAITQIMLIANPNQLNMSLKAMLSYSVKDDFCSEMGELDNLPL